jgi:hypothetical protein
MTRLWHIALLFQLCVARVLTCDFVRKKCFVGTEERTQMRREIDLPSGVAEGFKG